VVGQDDASELGPGDGILQRSHDFEVERALGVHVVDDFVAVFEGAHVGEVFGDGVAVVHERHWI